MPNAGDEIAERLEQGILNLPFFTELDQQRIPLPRILELALEGFAVEILKEDLPVRFACHCDPDRVLNAIKVLGEAEIRDMIAVDGKAEVRCHFCNERYVVAKEELERLVS